VASAIPIKLTDGAYVRLIASGPALALRVAISPQVDSKIRDLLIQNAQTDSILYANGGEYYEASIGSYDDGSLWLGDDIYGSGMESGVPGPLGYVPLTRMPSGQIDYQAMAAAVRAALRHYGKRFVIPLRMARRSDTDNTIPRRQLKLLIIPCADGLQLQQLRKQPDAVPPLAVGPLGRIGLTDSLKVAIAIQNDMRQRLHFLLFACRSSGRVELLGMDDDRTVLNQSVTVLGQMEPGGYSPYQFGIPKGFSWAIERLVIVAATDPRILDGLYYLKSCLEFQQEIDNYLSRTVVGDGRRARANPPEIAPRWMAACAQLQIGEERMKA
jgi:hypothetical protein